MYRTSITGILVISSLVVIFSLFHLESIRPRFIITETPTPKPRKIEALVIEVERGVASWYGPGFHGRLMANGEVYDQYAMTVASRTLPLGTAVFIKNLDNGRTCMARVNDRGPYIDGRIIDVSRGVAERLDMVEAGLANVSVSTFYKKDLTSDVLYDMIGPTCQEPR